ncbi:MAG: 6-phosphogluconolactonase [Blastocatellia bacterium]
MSTKMLNRSDAQVRVYHDAGEVALKAARHFARLADQYVLGCGRFTVALSGGSTPRAMFARLAEAPFIDTVPWESIYFFWGDERTVPPDHSDSNYRMAWETLLSRVPTPAENIFRIPAELPDPQRAADQYAATLINFFTKQATPSGTAPLAGVPRFDLIFLGMGPDGHPASLVPGTTALHVTDKIAVANYVEKFQTYRITLTAPVINNARNVTFVVAGADKAEALHEVLEGAYQPELYPSQLVHPQQGSLLWMVDEAAAAQLTQPHENEK